MSEEQDKLRAAVAARVAKNAGEKKAQDEAGAQIADAKKQREALIQQFRSFQPIIQKAVDTVNAEIKDVGLEYARLQSHAEPQISGRVFAAAFFTELKTEPMQRTAPKMWFLLNANGVVMIESDNSFGNSVPPRSGFALEASSITVDAMADLLRVLPRVLLTR
jgi:hypothetical protein